MYKITNMSGDASTKLARRRAVGRQSRMRIYHFAGRRIVPKRHIFITDEVFEHFRATLTADVSTGRIKVEHLGGELVQDIPDPNKEADDGGVPAGGPDARGLFGGHKGRAGRILAERVFVGDSRLAAVHALLALQLPCCGESQHFAFRRLHPEPHCARWACRAEPILLRFLVSQLSCRSGGDLR